MSQNCSDQTQMLTNRSLAKARAKSAEKTQMVSKLQEALQLLSPHSEFRVFHVDSSHSRPNFPDFETPMALPSNTEEGVATSAPQTCSRKQTLSNVLKSESSCQQTCKEARA
ncbi:hypothetical protein K438DRAFT_1760071 [Mycena galopus ATCC 62051]|nr:hypothetical protein K438DRAFT_1760071 [Mycena galopus ATCC 62051]